MYYKDMPEVRLDAPKSLKRSQVLSHTIKILSSWLYRNHLHLHKFKLNYIDYYINISLFSKDSLLYINVIKLINAI